MGTFSTNQFRNLFITSGYAGENVDPTTLTALQIGLDTYPAFNSNAGILLAILYNSAYEGILRSDAIPVKKIKDIRYIPTTGTYTPQETNVTISEAIPGQDYIIRIIFDNWGSGSAEDKYFIYASHRASSTDTTATIAAALAENLTQSLSIEAAEYFTVTSAGSTVTLTEQLPAFVPGKKSGEPYLYRVQIATINDANGLAIPAGEVEIAVPRFIPKGWGRTITDMEWFYLGERADQYRGMGYPDNFRTKLSANEDENYNVLEIKFFFSGDNEMVQESVKQLTIASTADLQPLVDAIEAAAPDIEVVTVQ